MEVSIIIETIAEGADGDSQSGGRQHGTVEVRNHTSKQNSLQVTMVAWYYSEITSRYPTNLVASKKANCSGKP